MKKSFIAIFFVVFAATLVAVPTDNVSAQTNYYYVPSSFNTYQSNTTVMSNAQLESYLRQLIIQLQAQINDQRRNSNYYQSNYDYNYNTKYNQVVGEPRSGRNSRNNDRYNDRDYRDDEPEAFTNNATSISRNSAQLRGRVDMNDFRNGEVFFVYGTDEYLVEEVEDDFTSYSNVRTRTDRLEKVRISGQVNGNNNFTATVSNLERNEDYFFSICVGFINDNNRNVITCGDVEEFSTNR